MFIKRNCGLVRSVTMKGCSNLVTDVDRRVERLIIERVRRRHAGDAVLSEECGDDGREGEYRWIIDPIDGTTNYFRSFPFFCVSIGIVQGREVKAGAICDPLRNELFHAAAGSGAFLNVKRIRVSAVSRLSESFLATGFAYGGGAHSCANIRRFERFLKASLGVRRAGSAALDLAYVACGRFDGFWEMGLHPWDTAAGWRIVEEAGGIVTRFDGTPFTLDADDILASNAHIHSHLSETLEA